jgi:hypothetical protein
MRPPKNVRENDAIMPGELKTEKLSIMRNFLWNEEITEEKANEVIKEFNRRWINAGGVRASTIILRGQE